MYVTEKAAIHCRHLPRKRFGGRRFGGCMKHEMPRDHQDFIENYTAYSSFRLQKAENLTASLLCSGRYRGNRFYAKASRLIDNEPPKFH